MAINKGGTKTKTGYLVKRVGDCLIPDPIAADGFFDRCKLLDKEQAWIEIRPLDGRSYKQLKLIHGVCKLVFESQNQEQVFKDLDALKTAIKIYVGFYSETERLVNLNLYRKEIEEQLGVSIPDNFKFKQFIAKDFKVGSFSYAATSQKKMNDVFNEIIVFILEKIAPTRPPEFEAKLQEMLEEDRLKSLEYE